MKGNALRAMVFVLIGLLTGSAAYSQSRTVLGKVTDEKGLSIARASVTVQNSTLGATTTETGDFSFKVPESAKYLVVSAVGFVPQTVPVSDDILAISLVSATAHLDEVVVIGYGTQKKSRATTAVSTVSSDFIDKQNVSRIDNVLQGSVPGVLVLGSTGQPGEKPMVRIRGTGTYQNPDPLYIVDGFPVSNIEFLNPGDIERMDILKDAASAAIYGARGANGVVLITTKSGKTGTTSISYDGYVGFQGPWRKVPLLNGTQYADMMNEGFRNAGMPEKYSNTAQYGKGTDWQDALFKNNAPVSNHQITVSGSTPKSSYLTSFSYFNQDGIIGGDKSRFDRFTVRLNGTQTIQSFLKVGANLNYMQTRSSGLVSNAEYGGILSDAVNIDPLTPVYETDTTQLNNLSLYPPGSVMNGNRFYGISPIFNGNPVNPLADIAIENGQDKYDRVFGNGFAELSIIKGLKAKSTFGIEITNYNGKGFTPIYYLNRGSFSNTNSMTQTSSRSTTWQTENTLSYNKSINNEHNFEVLVGQTAVKYVYENLAGIGQDLSVNDANMAYFDLVTDLTSIKLTGGADNRTLSSYFGRVNYDYKGKYLFSGVLRRDGSSRFGSNNPYATFPSVSAGWVVSKEDFFHSKNIGLLKLRGSWGRNGNENVGYNSFPWAATMSFGNGYTFVDATGAEYILNGAALTQTPNPNIKWETGEQTDIGIDAELLNGKLTATVDWYNKKTIGLLFSPSIPAIVGTPAPLVNSGSVRNRGIELGIGYADNINKDWHYSARLNFAYNKNTVLAMNKDVSAVYGPSYVNAGSVTAMKVGEPIGYFWGYKTNGLFQTQAEVNAYVNKDGALLEPDAKPGDIRFVDLNGDGNIDDDDKTKIGDPNPSVTTGLNLNLSYKHFDFSCFFVGMFGNQLLNGMWRYDLQETNMPATHLNRWTAEGSNAKFPRFTFDDENGNYSKMSDLYIENANFVRLKNIQIGYTFPLKSIGQVKLSQLRLYIASDNLFTITKYSGFDPEIGARSPLDIGIDRGAYPQSRTVRVGLNLGL